MIDSSGAPKLTRNEGLKVGDPTLAGTIASTLADPAADHFGDDDYEFLKFHGIYQQDDRDLRKTGKKWIFMVRGRLPGGRVTARQYLAFDALSREHGNDTLRITSRQGFQFHGVVKSGLRPLIRGMHEVLATTLAACGDVNRNVMAPPTPARGPVVNEVHEDARALSDALLPATPAYHEIWLDGVEVTPVDHAGVNFVDPLYGTTYLPRKFKVAFVIPPLNDVDVYANDLGFVAVIEGGRLAGYNLLAGGGLGMSHGNQQTYPRLADAVGFVPRERMFDAARAVLRIHADFGDRTNRKHARLKYVLAERGLEWFRGALAERLGWSPGPVKPFELTHQGDVFGWGDQHDGRVFLGLYVEAGRIADREGYRLKAALREVVEAFRPEVRLTPSQNLLLTGLRAEDRDRVTQVLGAHGVVVSHQASPLRRLSMACPSMPTCGLGLAESERALPSVLARLEALLTELGLGEQAVAVRMTGCPNGCVRPYLAEIGLVGKAPGRYHLSLGGNLGGTRLNRVHREGVRDAELMNELRPVLARYAAGRLPEEGFGDWCARVLWAEAEGGARIS